MQTSGLSDGNIRYDSNSVEVLPVRGSDPGEILINDHQVIKGLLAQLVAANAADTRLAALESLKAALTIHNAMEETLFYPALATVAGKAHESQHLYTETAEADVVVFRLDTMLKTGETTTFGETARALQAAILEHIDDEEEKAIPHLQKHAEPNQSALLLTSMREFRARIRMHAIVQ